MRVPTRVSRSRPWLARHPALAALTATSTVGDVVSFSLRTSDEKLVQRRERPARGALQNIADVIEGRSEEDSINVGILHGEHHFGDNWRQLRQWVNMDAFEKAERGVGLPAQMSE